MEALAKRQVSLTQVVAVLTIVAVIGFLRWQRTDAVLDDTVSLHVLASLETAPTAIDGRQLEASLPAWIDQHAPQWTSGRLRARDAVVTWLNSANSAIKGDSFTGKGGKKLLRLDELPDLDAPPGPRPEAVDEYIARLDERARRHRVCVVTDWRAPSDPKYATRIQGASAVLPEEVRLHGNLLEICYGDACSGPAGQINSQEDKTPLGIPVTPSCDDAGPTLFDMAPRSDTSMSQVELAARRAELDRLHRRYGRLPLTTAQEIARGELGAAYQTVDLLGFGVSPEHLAFALLLVMTVILWLLGITIREAVAVRDSLRAIELDSWFAPILHSDLLRLAAWAGSPPLAVLAAIPAASPDAWIRGLLVGAAALLLAGGAWCWHRSRPLWKRTAAPA
jgi:hypothetical protein